MLKPGIGKWKLRYFPAVRSYDNQRNEGLYCNWSFGLWALIDVENCPTDAENLAKFVTPLVINNLEYRKLCYASPLKGKTLSWIKPCLEKLTETKLSNTDLITVLTFVTCIAQLMNDHYVDFNRL